MQNSTITFQVLIIAFLAVFNANAQQVGDTLSRSKQLIAEGIRLHDEEKYADAIAMYKKVLPYDTNYTTALYEISLSHFAAKEYQKAISTCKIAVKKFEDYRLDNLMLIAQSYDELEMRDSSYYFYNQAKKQSPNSSRPYYEESIPLRKENKWDQAIIQLDSARMKNIFKIRPHYMYSDIAYGSGEPAIGLLALHFASLITNDGKSQYATYQSLVKMSDDNYESSLKAPSNIIKNCESLAEINELVKAKVALTPKYKVKSKIDERYTRQMQLILERLDQIPTEKENPMANFYLDFYKQVWEKGYFEAAILSGLNALTDVQIVVSSIKKKKSEIDAFEKWASEYLIAKRANYIQSALNVPENIEFIFHNGGEMAGYGPRTKDKPRNGEWIFFYDQGFISAKGPYDSEGKKTGHWDYYYKNGKKSQEEDFDNANNKLSYVKYYSNGNKQEASQRVNGQIDGDYQEYHITGAPKRKILVKAGKITGIMYGYTSNGALDYEREFNGDGKPGTYKSFFGNGQLSTEVSITNDLLNGIMKKYYPTGQLKEQVNYINDKKDGISVSYYRTGALKDSAIYKSDKLNGKKKSYNINGSINSELEYKNGKINGLSIWYDDTDGKMYGQLQFKNERLSSYEFFDKEGKSMFKKEEIGSQIDWVRHTPYGRITERGTYKKGEFYGTFEKYFPNGSRSAKYTYEDGKTKGFADYYYRNENKSSEYYYDDKGNRQGFAKGYHVTGELKYTGYYLDNEAAGPWIYLYRDSTIDSDEFYIDGKMKVDIEYMPDGNINSIDEFEGGEAVNEKIYNENNKLIVTTEMRPEKVHVKEAFSEGYTWKEGDLEYGNRTGKWVYNYGINRPKAISNYLFGALNGVSINYHPNGNIKTKGTYVMGSVDSIYEFYDELGRLNIRRNYDLGDYTGIETLFYPSGKVFAEYSYLDDELNGPSRFYAETGELMIERYYYNGEIISYSYEDQNGKLIKKDLITGTGEITAFYKSGKPSVSIQMNNGQKHGQHLIYSPNGIILESKNYVDGELNGAYKETYTNGKPYIETTYEYGKLNGTKKVFNTDGSLFSVEEFRQDIIHGEATYYNTPDKKPVKVQFYFGHEIKK